MSRAEEYWRNAEAAREREDWKRADEFFRRALAADVESVAVRIAYGAFLAEREKFGVALEQLMHAKDQAAASGNLDGQALVFAQLAMIYRQIGQFDLARRFQRQVLAIRPEADASDLLAWSTNALMANKTQLAESLAQTALSLAEDAGALSIAADCFGVLGLIAARHGEHRCAISLLIKAIRRHQSLEDTQALGTDYANLGEVCGMIGRLKWQQIFTEAAAARFQRAGMPQSHRQMEQRLRTAHILRHHGAVPPQWN